MRLLLDSANIDEVKRFAKTSAIAGVTTNPSLVAKEKKRDYTELLCEIADVLNASVFPAVMQSSTPKHFSVEVTTLDPDEMIEQATTLSSTLKHRRPNVDVHIKIPVMPETLRVLSVLRHERFVKTNATACMTALQAKIAADAGATVVSFFYNRMIDGNMPQRVLHGKGVHNVGDEGQAREQAQMELAFYPRDTAPFICGSVRTTTDVRDLMIAGANYVTVSAKILDEMLKHPKTIEAIEAFDKDIKTWGK